MLQGYWIALDTAGVNVVSLHKSLEFQLVLKGKSPWIHSLINPEAHTVVGIIRADRKWRLNWTN